MHHGIAVELAGQRAQRIAHLRRTANARVQALVVGLVEGQHLAGRAGARARAGDAQRNLLNEFALERCARAVKHHYAHAGFCRRRTFISPLTRAVAGARAP